MFLIYLFIFIFGACVGSFLNVVILRLHSGEKFIRGRSHCQNCGHVLSWLENIPLASFIFLHGRCKNCQTKISWQYPLVEFTAGILFIIPLFFYPSILLILYSWAVISFLIIIFVYDFKYQLILDKIILPAIIVVLFSQAFLLILKNNFNYSLLTTHYLFFLL